VNVRQGRRSVAEIVESGISTLAELQEAILTAIEIEFSTIPPYLCAEWSISNDPSNVATLVRGVVVQEMLHFGLACNLYTATGGSLQGQIATEGFVPTYPTELPGGVHPGLEVSLAPLTQQSLSTFMSIEYPDTQPVVQAPPAPPTPPAPAPLTIGDFYKTIGDGFKAVFPSGTLPNVQNQVQTKVGSDMLFSIASVADALNAIDEITTQGEGTSASPDEGSFDQNQLAHFYTFAEIYYGHEVQAVGTGWQYTGALVQMPAVYQFSPSSSQPVERAEFIASFSKVLRLLEQSWTGGGVTQLQTAIGEMGTLRGFGVSLIKNGVTPPFTYVSV
jgi:Ferritin-like